jgi:hypothetical protein
LYIEYPRITFFDWLVRLPQFREAFPKLSRVQIACSDEAGDSYELFKFIEHDHHGWTALRSIGVQLEIFYHYGWNADWDDYDLEALGLDAWQVTLGAPILGIQTQFLTCFYITAKLIALQASRSTQHAVIGTPAHQDKEHRAGRLGYSLLRARL